MTILIKNPLECSKEELDKFEKLVLLGGQVSPEGLRKRILKCRYLGLCYIENEIVSISAIKKPSHLKIKRTIEAAKIKKAEVPTCELGYLVTKEGFRGKGINSDINNSLLDKLEKDDRVFATTSNDHIRKYLITKGFKKIGEPFEGKYNEVLDYYEKLK